MAEECGSFFPSPLLCHILPTLQNVAIVPFVYSYRKDNNMPVRKADATWEGTLQEGNGHMKMATGAYDGPFSFKSRFEDGTGTNPEELIAAAHAGCFSMALSGGLGRAGFPPVSVHTTANVHINRGDAGFRITKIELETEANVPGIDEAKFQEVANATKSGCPVSVALAAVPEITLKAKLVS
jgi:osmotically inducible protein OsmC